MNSERKRPGTRPPQMGHNGPPEGLTEEERAAQVERKRLTIEIIREQVKAGRRGNPLSREEIAKLDGWVRLKALRMWALVTIATYVRVSPPPRPDQGRVVNRSDLGPALLTFIHALSDNPTEGGCTVSKERLAGVLDRSGDQLDRALLRAESLKLVTIERRAGETNVIVPRIYPYMLEKETAPVWLLDALAPRAPLKLHGSNREKGLKPGDRHPSGGITAPGINAGVCGQRPGASMPGAVEPETTTGGGINAVNSPRHQCPPPILLLMRLLIRK